MKKKILIFIGLLIVAVIFIIRKDAGQIIDKKYDISKLNVATADQIENIALQFIKAKKGDKIRIPAGYYEFDSQLYLDGASNVTIIGDGMNATILSFKNMTVGAEGIKISADSVTIANLTILDSRGDNIKIQNSNKVTISNVRSTWSNGPLETNGAYAIYPVTCKNVLIEKCEVSNASDAGIYVGQSQNIVVKDNYVFNNVAGIEIENCINSEVYNNTATQNTGGILMFDLPGLPAGNGNSCKIYNNKIIENNLKNFAPEGNIVGVVPPGTGMILLAAKKAEVFDNEIRGNKTFGIAISSYHLVEKPWKDKNYDPFTYDIYIHNNTIDRDGFKFPDVSKKFGKLIVRYFYGKTQDIIYDGITDETRESSSNPMNICIKNDGENFRFAMLDVENNFKHISTDLSIYDCDFTVTTDVTSVK